MSDAPYDPIAEAYAERYAAELASKPLDRALLRMLAEELGPGAKVGDVGCGPGHVAAHLQGLGLRAVGVDLSPQMIGLARARFPGPEFHVASMLRLPADDGAWQGLVALYSIIHLQPDERPAAFTELHRVLAPGGPALVAFHVGDGVRHVDELLGRAVSLDFHFLQPDAVAAQLDAAGFDVEISLQRTAYAPVETHARRAYIMARAR